MKQQTTFLRKSAPRKSAPRECNSPRVELAMIFGAINNFLAREGDKHFCPDRYDEIHDRWAEDGSIAPHEVKLVKEIFEKWVRQ